MEINFCMGDRKGRELCETDLGLEKNVSVGEEALLERDDDELGALEAVAEELADVLRVAQVESRINLVQDVHRRGLELEERHDEGEGDKGPGRSLEQRVSRWAGRRGGKLVGRGTHR